MMGLHGEFLPASKRYINDYIQYVKSDFLAGLGFGATQIDVYKRQPLVPKGYDFLGTIGKLAHIRQDGTATCEAKGDGTD